MVQGEAQRLEALGPAERTIQALVTFADHMYHGRPGMVVPAPGAAGGVQWFPVSHKVQADGVKLVSRHDKVGKKTNKVPVGTMNGDGVIKLNGREVGQYRSPGLFEEICAQTYQHIADVWQLDNEFAAKWASFAYKQEHRDLKVALAAFMLVQNRYGEPVMDGGKLLFRDEDYREVGEAMCLLMGDKRFDAKMLLRIGMFLELPKIAEINRKLGFGLSLRKPFLGRWPKAVSAWLAYREANPKLLQGLVKSGQRTTVIALAQKVGYKPESPDFFKVLRWKQTQAKDGRRQIAIGAEVAAAETWNDLTEQQICERIVQTKPNYKRVVGLLPSGIGLTRAVMAACIDAGSVSDKDLIILGPTLEELGLLNIAGYKQRWEAALGRAEDQRARHVAQNMKSKELQEKTEQAADVAAAKVIEEATRGLKVYIGIDVSGSMTTSIEKAKAYLAHFLGAFPLEKTVVATFNTMAREIKIRHPSKAGVEQAFRGVGAGGGTDHGCAVRDIFRKYPPAPGEDALFIFIGDEEQYGTFQPSFANMPFMPVAFGLLHVGHGHSRCVRDTAAGLRIPCFDIDEKMFGADGTAGDVYAVTRVLRNLIESTPVGQTAFQAVRPVRKSLVQQILEVELLRKPAWA